MMWILHICHSYYPPFLDCARQYNALFKNTPYKVLTVYLTGDEDKDVVLATQSDEVVFLGYKSKDVSGLKLGAIAKIKAIAKERNFLFCIAHRVKPTYVALLATDLPVVSVHHNYNDYSRWSRRLIVNFYQDRLLMLGVSNAVRDDLRRDLKGWSPERIQTLYNRIDVEATQAKLLSKQDARKKFGIQDRAWVLGTAGRLHHDKDYPTLLRGFAKAMPSLPSESLLIIMGKGPLESKLKVLTQQLGIDGHVTFLGHVPNGAQYFRAFDGFVLTSDREPFGMVLLEAMAAEVPIICSDCGGGAEVVEGVGQLFEFGNIEQLTSCLQHFHAGNHEASTKKLNDQFSDEAIRKVFFEIDFIQRALNFKVEM